MCDFLRLMFMLDYTFSKLNLCRPVEKTVYMK
jgi:hypothetical protein